MYREKIGKLLRIGNVTGLPGRGEKKRNKVVVLADLKKKKKLKGEK